MRTTFRMLLTLLAVTGCGPEPEVIAVPSGTVVSVWGNADDDIWFGGYGASGALVLHYNGTNLTEVSLPDGATSTLEHLWGSGPSDVWAAGPEVFDEGAEILHFDGASWQITLDLLALGATDSEISDLWGSGPDNVWLVGWTMEQIIDVFLYTSFVYRWDGAAWTLQAVPIPNDGVPVSVWTSGPSDVAIAYYSCPPDPGSCFTGVLFYNGSAWRDEIIPFSHLREVLLRGTVPGRPYLIAERSTEPIYRWSGFAFEHAWDSGGPFEFVFVRGEGDIVGGYVRGGGEHPWTTTLSHLTESTWSTLEIDNIDCLGVWASQTRAWLPAANEVVAVDL